MHTFEKQQCNSQCTSLDFNEEEILKIIGAVNIHKPHGHDDIFVRMKTNCDKSLLKPLIILFFYFKIQLSFLRFLLEERLLNPNLSGCPSYPCINQLLAITHEIFEAFDCNPPLEIRSIFSDISKAFDKM